MDDGGAGAVFLSTLLFAGIITGVIGLIIDGMRGFFWGFFLGPIGWVIAAILKSSDRKAIVYNYVNSSQPSSADYAIVNPRYKDDTSPYLKFDVKKWDVLKEVDAEISSAVKKVRAVDVNLEYELAEKYLILGQKEYLHQIADSLIGARKIQIAEENLRRKSLEEKYSESSIVEIMNYEKSLGKDKFDEDFGATAIDVQTYDGSWVAWKGGIVVKFSDGRTLIKNKGMSRIFYKGDDRWK